MTYSISSFPHLLLLAESITFLDEKMELTGSELAQCPAPVPTHPGRHEVPFLLWKVRPLLRPGSDPHLQDPSSCSSFTSPAALEGSILSVPFSRLLSCPASPLGSPHLFPLSSVSQTLHLSSPLCFPFTLKPAFCRHHITELLSQSTPMASTAKSHR